MVRPLAPAPVAQEFGNSNYRLTFEPSANALRAEWCAVMHFANTLQPGFFPALLPFLKVNRRRALTLPPACS